MAGKIRNFYEIVRVAEELVGLAQETFKDYYGSLVRGNEDTSNLDLAKTYLLSASSLITPLEGRRPRDEHSELSNLRQGIQRGLESISKYQD